MTSTTYAIADLHGRDDLLEIALIEIAARGGGTVVFLGDYIDRGPGSRAVIERLIAGPPEGQRWYTLMGNHEAFLLHAMEDAEGRAQWLDVGGREALISYGWSGQGEAEMHRIPVAHRRWMRQLPQYHCDRHRIYVHAGVDPTLSLEAQTEQRLLWQIHTPETDLPYGDRHVVHGHEHRPDGPILKRNRTNLDTHAWHTGRLAVGVFEDAAAGGPTDLIEIRL
jgi:serine/threonine protein phosphatase 1